MTQRDKWKHRPIVDQYYAFKDRIRLHAIQQKFVLGDAFAMRVTIPMPKSWTLKKKGELLGQPHQQKPDADNILKAVQDCLLGEDSKVWCVHVEKRWGPEGEPGRIEIINE